MGEDKSAKLKERVQEHLLADADVRRALGKMGKALREGLAAERSESVYVLTRSSMPGLVRIGSTLGDPEQAPELRDSASEPPYVLAGFARVADSRAVERRLLDDFGGARTIEDRQVVRVDLADALLALWRAANGPIEAPGVEEVVRQRLKQEHAFALGGEITVSISGDEAFFTFKLGGRSEGSGGTTEIARLDPSLAAVDDRGASASSPEGVPSSEQDEKDGSEPVSRRAAVRWRIIEPLGTKNPLGFGKFVLWLFGLWAFWGAAADGEPTSAVLAALIVTALFALRLMSNSGVQLRPPWQWRVRQDQVG